ncbi:hypothetical protein QE152_g5222 [Popillia japonica]|uniref:Uncharacterized protein n=1 Tax=Popillia japonica TaxID=7064 RepID=A0AAW1MTK7_POPJA
MVKSEDVLTEKRLMVHWMNRQDPTIGNMRSKALQATIAWITEAVKQSLQATIAWITEAVKQSRPIQPWKTKLPNESRQHQQQKMRKRLQIKNTVNCRTNHDNINNKK